MRLSYKLSKETFIYGIGILITRSIILFLIPVYTRIFTPGEYGRIELLTQIGLLVGEFINLGMDSAQSLYFNKVKDDGIKAQARIISSILQLRLIWGSFFLCIVLLCSVFINSILFNSELSSAYFVVLFFGIFLNQITYQCAEIFRLRYLPINYVLFTSLSILLGIPFILFFALKIKLGIFGFLLGTTIGHLITTIYAISKIKSYIIFEKIYSYLWPKVLRFGLPLSLSAIIFYLMNTADRYFIEIYNGDYELGLYSAAAKLSLIITGFVTPFRYAWWPRAMSLIYQKNGYKLISEISKIYLGISFTIMILLTLFSQLIIKSFTTFEYYEAWKLIGILMWPIVCYGFSTICSVGIWKSEKTLYGTTSNFIAVILGILLNYLMVPKYGSVGAAIATSLTFTFWIVLITYFSKKLENIKLPYLILFSQAFTAIVSIYIIIINDPSKKPFVCFITFVLSSFIFLILGFNDRISTKFINSAQNNN
tara:strand:+ start:5387 stop:6829 length:1443 start_codon:yes stop_codon:yes gene_type:complete